MGVDRQVDSAATTSNEAPWLIQNGIHLMVLWAFAVAQPTFDLVSQGPDLFVQRKVDGAAFVTVVVFFTVLPPLVLLGIEALANGVSTGLRDALHRLFVWGLAALFATYTLKQLLPSAGLGLLVGGTVLGALATFVYDRWAPVGSFLSVLAPAPAIFVVLFLFSSPSEGLIFPKQPQRLEASIPGRTPIIWVVFDELPISSMMNRHQLIDEGRFPNFARLAEQSTWYRNTAASGDETRQAVPAILTGERPQPAEIETFTDHPVNLFTLLAATHKIIAMEHATWLCPPSECGPERSAVHRMADLMSAMSLAYVHTVAPERYERRLPVIGRSWQEAIAWRDLERRVDPADIGSVDLSRYGDAQFERFLQSVKPGRAGDRPTLYFLHSSFPHIPWNYLPSGKRYADFEDLPPALTLSGGTRIWVRDPPLVAQAFQRHLLQAMLVDRLLGRLLRHLKQTGLLDRSLLVVTADHGVSFRPGLDRRALAAANAGDVGLVPFFIKAPRQTQGRVTDKQIQTIDELPTAMRVLGAKLPRTVDGRPAQEMKGAGRQVAIDYRRYSDVALRFRFRRLLAERKRTLRRQLGLFGSGPVGARFFGFGRFRDLAGKRVADLPMVAADGDVDVDLEDAERFEDVDLESPYVPALVRGRIWGDGAGQAHDVAVALNGRIAAVAPTYLSDGVQFSLVVPDNLFRDGRNEVSIYSVSSLHRDISLELVGGSEG